MCVHVRNVRMVAAAGKQHTPPLCAATKERLLLFGSFFCSIKAAAVSRWQQHNELLFVFLCLFSLETFLWIILSITFFFNGKADMCFPMSANKTNIFSPSWPSSGRGRKKKRNISALKTSRWKLSQILYHDIVTSQYRVCRDSCLTAVVSLGSSFSPARCNGWWYSSLETKWFLHETAHNNVWDYLE